MTRTILIAAALALAVTLPAMPAQAQTRVFVSAIGIDTNSCVNVASPCRHFQQAYDKMPSGGEIDVLDPANYGALTAIHTLSIVGRGWATLSPVTGQAAITINAGPSDKIAISGLTLDGANLASTTGILFNSGANLTVSDSVIQNSTGNGISFLPTASGGISVSRTVVSKNGGGGILVQPQGSASATADFEQVQTQYNGANGYGINIDATATTGAIVATATDSISSNNGGGFIAQGSTFGTVLMLVRCTASNNHTGVESGIAGKMNGAVYLSQVAIVGNQIGWISFAGGLASYGDNTIEANLANNGAPPSVPKK